MTREPRTAAKRKAQFATASAILTLLALGVIFYRTFVASVESVRWVRHTHEVLEKFKDLQTAMVAVESNARGFVLTGEESYLASYRAAVEAATRDEAAARGLTIDNATQQRRFPRMESLIAAKVQRANAAITLRRARGLQVAADALHGLQGQRIMNEFLASASEFEGEELRLLAQRDAAAKRRGVQTRMALIFVILAGWLISAAAAWSVQRDNFRRELAEKEMRESEERFRDLANNISQFAWMADEQGSIFWYNQRWFDYTGTTLDEMVGWGWKKVHHPDHVQAVVDKISQCFRAGETWDDTFPLRGRDGTYRWFLSRAVPIRDHQGSVLRWFGTNTDITERRTAELLLVQRESTLIDKNKELAEALSKIREVSEHKSRFLANMSHELRTPLNGIIGFNEMIHDGRTGPVNELQKEFLGDSLRSAKHLLNLINDLLDLEKIEAGRLMLRPELFEVCQLVVETVEENRGISVPKQLRLVLDLHIESIWVFLDRQKTKQVLLNLIMNAIKFTAEGGGVTARVRLAAKERVLIEIEDTGIGISELDQKRLFREFEQLESSASKHYQGTGLGLALTRKLVEAQGGVISVASEVGVGSIFSISLPISNQASLIPPAQPDVVDETVLVMEGELETSPITEALNAAGYMTENTGSIAEVVDRVNRRHYRALVTALVLPEGSGLDLVREIRRREHNSDLPIFVVTGIPEDLAPQGFAVQDALTRAAAPSEVAAMLGSVSHSADCRQVLVVDDDPNVHKLVSTALRGTGLDVLSCFDGEAGLRALQIRRPAAVVVDLLMPKLDGFNFISRLQTTAGAANIPVFVWTNLDLTPDQLRTLTGAVRQIVFKGDGGIATLIKALRKQLPHPVAKAVL